MSDPIPNTLPFVTTEAPQAIVEMGRRLDKLEIDRCASLSRFLGIPEPRLAPLVPSVDHSKYISYIRHQGAYGCGLNAGAACLDILFSMASSPSFEPNMSVNRLLWGWHWPVTCQPEGAPCNQRSPGKIPGMGGANYWTLDEYLYNFGCPTEGNELTNSDAVQWPTDEGNQECSNYRLDKHPQSFAAGYGLNTPEFQKALDDAFALYAGNPMAAEIAKAIAPQDYSHHVKVDLNELKYWLTLGPVRVGVHGPHWGGGHFVALVGYDDNERRFKLVNSWGDRWHDPGADDGFGFITYDNLNQEVDSAQVYKVRPPAYSVQCAKIQLKSQYRQDVHLWVGWDVPHYTGKPAVRRIWPNGQRQDNSCNLSLIVALPPGFVWPPSPTQRVFLDVYDSGAHSDAGGTIDDFTVGLGGQYYYCGDLVQGTPDDNPLGGPHDHPQHSGHAKSFKPRQMLRLTVP